MNFTKAFAVFMQIDSKEFTEDEKYEAIQKHDEVKEYQWT